MAVDTFIPEVWNAQLITALEENLILADPGSSVNTNYEGDIAQAGDTVHIARIADPVIADYIKNVTIINPATLSTTDETFTITQSKYFAFEVDDVDRRQALNAGALMNEAAKRAAYGMRALADTFVGAQMVAGAGTVLDPMDIVAADAADAYAVILRLKLALDKKLIPQEGRWLTCDPSFYALLLLDPRFIDASKYGGSGNTPLHNGEVGKILNFTVKVSTHLPKGTAGAAGEVSSFVIAGHQMATTFAQQINKTEAYRPESSFSDAIKGLHLYGAKVIQGEALAVIDVDVTI